MRELPAHQPADVRATPGWNTWCTYGDCAQPFEPHPDPNHDICNAAEIISVAEAMKANGMSAIGWEYINCKITALQSARRDTLAPIPLFLPQWLQLLRSNGVHARVS